MKNLNRIMEFFWLGLAILSTLGAIYYVNILGWDEGWYYLLFPAVALMMFLYRRGMRSRLDKWSKGER